jgi:adenine C2-methylase RlmN of 23S rRNA A2503 and tRNA A37
MYGQLCIDIMHLLTHIFYNFFRFCATGTMGIIGDLTAGEIVEQLIHANAVTRIRNVVFMGMGEPLNNFENVKKAVEFMVDSKRFGLCKFGILGPA